MNGQFLLTVSLLCLATYTLLKMLLSKHKHTTKGSFCVNGKGILTVNLCNKHKPKKCLAYFIDEFSPDICHPCNPHHDSVGCQVIWSNGFKLIINFDVIGTREIAFEVIY